MTCPWCIPLRSFTPRNFPSRPLCQIQQLRTIRPRPPPPSRFYPRPRCSVYPAVSASRTQQQRRFSSATDIAATAISPPAEGLRVKPEQEQEPAQSPFPLCCPGCGAFSQTLDPSKPGYYSKTRKRTRKLLAEIDRTLCEESAEGGREDILSSRTEAEDVARETKMMLATAEAKEDGEGVASQRPKSKTLKKFGVAAIDYLAKSTPPVQVCDRCHDLIHHNKATPIAPMSIREIREYLDASPHKENHVYHILDAADFPMSLIDGVYDALSLKEQRSRNRRSKTEKYKAGRKMTDITYVITRSDLLAAQPKLVDSKMEYMRSVLIDALGKSSNEIRLGNLYMISCFRGWRSRHLREQIGKQGGGVWVVGKTNVGKSQFIDTCFPKDSTNLEKIAELLKRRGQEDKLRAQQKDFEAGSHALLPPAPREELYPVLPVASSLSGTTVSPIRIPFGRGKGEMIDLPGVHRDGLECYVLDEYRSDLTMTKYIRSPERHTIGATQSLLLAGGLIRVTAVNSVHVLEAVCFVPIEAHVTNTERAIKMQAQDAIYPKTNIMKPGVGETISSAGAFQLKWDVTKQNLPRTLEKAVKDRGVRIPELPYKVFAADLVVEGLGWIELSMQVRTKAMNTPEDVPRVEVFTPNGRHVGWRSPIQCYSFVEERKRKSKRQTLSRQRQNVDMKKRQASGSRR